MRILKKLSNNNKIKNKKCLKNKGIWNTIKKRSKEKCNKNWKKNRMKSPKKTRKIRKILRKSKKKNWKKFLKIFRKFIWRFRQKRILQMILLGLKRGNLVLDKNLRREKKMKLINNLRKMKKFKVNLKKFRIL